MLALNACTGGKGHLVLDQVYDLLAHYWEHLERMPGIASSQDHIFESWVFANQPLGIDSVCAPAHRSIDQLSPRKMRQAGIDQFIDRDFTFGGESIRRVLGV